MWAGLHEAFPNLVVYLDLSGTFCILSVWPVRLAFEAAYGMEHASSKESGGSHQGVPGTLNVFYSHQINAILQHLSSGLPLM